MTFSFDAGNPIDNVRSHNMLTDAVRDQLRPNHSEDEYRYAYARTVETRLYQFKDARWLLRFWHGQSGPLAHLADGDPVLFLDLVNHLSAKLEELT